MRQKTCLIIYFMAVALGIYAQSDSTQVAVADTVVWDKELDEVSVSAQRQLVKQEIDRIGYDVQADEDAKTETVFDMLRKVPMVTIDAQENILVRGSSRFKVYKNNRHDPNLTRNAREIFKAMPATAVKRIEVITDPGAREDAEGVNAVLNIVMMAGSTMDGMMGSATLSYSSLRHPNANAYLATQAGKAIISVDYGYGGMSERETASQSTSERRFLNTGNHMQMTTEGSNPGYIHYANVNASYDIDSLNLLSLALGGYFYKLNVLGSGTTTMFDGWGNKAYSYAESYDLPDYMHHSWNGRMDFQHKTKRDGEQFTLSYMLALTRQQTLQQTLYTEADGVPFDYTGYNLASQEHFTEHTIQADWLRPLTKGHRLEVGAKYINRQNNSRSEQDFMAVSALPTTHSRFNHTTMVAAVYADYFVDWGKWSGRAGLRYEHSRLSGRYPDGEQEGFHRRLGDWVPQASLKYQLSEKQSMKLSYTTSINRPGISYLNPAVTISPETMQYGNAMLTSATQRSVSLTYMYVGRKLTLNVVPHFTYLSNGIGGVVSAEGNLRISTYDNVERIRRWSLESYAQWKPWEQTLLSGNLLLSHSKLSNAVQQLSLVGSSVYYYVYLSQQLPWKLRATGYVFGEAGRSVHNVYSYNRPWHRYGFTLQRSFLSDERLTVRLSASVPFNRHNFYGERTTRGDLGGWSDNYYAGRSVMLSVSYRFGKLKTTVKKTDTTIDNSDVVGGISRGK